MKYRNMLSRRSLFTGLGSGLIVAATGSKLLRATPQGNPLTDGESPGDWGGHNPLLYQRADAYLLPLLRTVSQGKRPDPTLFSAAYGRAVDAFADMEAVGLNAHIEQNFGKYIKHRAYSQTAIEARMAAAGVQLPPNYWGKMESAIHQMGTLRNWHTTYHWVLTWLSRAGDPLAAAGTHGGKLAGVRRPPLARGFVPTPSPAPQTSGTCYDNYGNAVACDNGTTSTINYNVSVCYDANGNAIPCQTDSSGSSGVLYSTGAVIGAVAGGLVAVVGFVADGVGAVALAGFCADLGGTMAIAAVAGALVF